MNKDSHLLKFFKKISLFINSLILKNSKKLNVNVKKKTLRESIDRKRLVAIIIILLVLGISYLSIPMLYNKSKLQDQIKNQLFKRFDIKFKFSTDMNYNLFPWPNFTFENVEVYNNEIKISNVKKLKINLGLKNFFFMEKIELEDIFLQNARFNIYKKNLKFFYDILNNDLSKSEINISNSYIFVRDSRDEVLLINKINGMRYYYDVQKLQNILEIENEIFKIPYYLKVYNNKNEKKIFSEIKINILKSSFISEYSYAENIKTGSIYLINNKNKSEINFKINKEKLIFKFFDKMSENSFNYNGEVFLKPFFMNLNGEIKRIDLKYLKNSNSVLIQFLKTELLNNENLNFISIINVEKILPYQKVINLLLDIKIKEGLIDIDGSKFSWSDYADFNISNSLIYLSNNNLMLDGKMTIDIKKYNDIYKFFQTPRNFRKEIENLEFVFNYNFDQEVINISNVKIDNLENQKVTKILNKLVSKENILENRIYLKNLINKALKAYSG